MAKTTLKIQNCDKPQLLGGLSRNELLEVADIFFNNIPQQVTKKQLCAELQRISGEENVERLAAELDRLRVRYTRRQRIARRNPFVGAANFEQTPVQQQQKGRAKRKREQHDIVMSGAGFADSAGFAGFSEQENDSKQEVKQQLQQQQQRSHSVGIIPGFSISTV